MKYNINSCHSCNRLKDGRCKNPVCKTPKEHGGCSDWENPEMYEAWLKEFGQDFNEIMEMTKEHICKTR